MAERPVVEPILPGDVLDVARYLHENTTVPLTPELWRRTIAPGWSQASTNHGFLLRRRGDIVGVYVTYQSERTSGGTVRRVCNLSTWWVDDDSRPWSLLLLRAILAQDFDLYTDVSPSPLVVRINERLGFRLLSNVAQRVPNIPRPRFRSGVRLVADPEVARELLSGDERRAFDDHLLVPDLQQLVIVVDGVPVHVVLKDYPELQVGRAATLLRQKGVVAVVHVGRPDLFGRAVGALQNYLVLRRRRLFMLVEERQAGHRPRFSRPAGIRLDRMYRGDGVRPDDIDYLYSELMFIERTATSAPRADGRGTGVRSAPVDVATTGRER